SKEAKIALKAPLIDHTVEITLEPQVTTKMALERLRDAVMEVRPEIYDLAIRSPEVLSRPDVLDIVLKDHRNGHGISLFELNKGSLVVKKISYRRETQVYTFEFEATEGRFRVAET